MKSYANISEYISNYPKDAQAILKKIRATVKKAAPKATETIKYGIPTFYQGENLVHFAAYKTHIGFYPTSTGITHFKKELAAYNTSKGTVQFPIDEKKIPYSLITKIVKFRVKESSQE